MRARLDKGQTTNGSSAFGRATAHFLFEMAGDRLRRTPGVCGDVPHSPFYDAKHLENQIVFHNVS